MTVTSYIEVYERFLSKIHDYEILKDIEENPNFTKEILLDFLKSASVNFSYTDIDFDEVMDNDLETFTIELTSTEKEILARLMVVEYMSPRIIKSELFEQRLGSKDFQLFSPGNLLGKLRELRNDEERKTNALMLKYYYESGL